MSVLPLAAAAVRFYSVAAQHFSTEQIEQDRKSDTDTTLKHAVHFQDKMLRGDARS